MGCHRKEPTAFSIIMLHLLMNKIRTKPYFIELLCGSKTGKKGFRKRILDLKRMRKPKALYESREAVMSMVDFR